MSIRRLVICLSLVFLAVVMIGVAFRSQLSSQGGGQTPTIVAGRNVNMVSGTTLPGGDPWLQRQNEPSIAVSSRNPLHLLAGCNDYRTVDMPISEGELPGKGPVAMVGDAWLGVFTSYDGGESWTSTMLPGYPQDPLANPLKGYRTAADPVVRCGPNGLFYYSGIALNRDTNLGVVFVARFIDNNNSEAGNSIQYLDTKIIAVGSATKFLDKPWIAVDQPRAPMTNVAVAGQIIPRHNVYIAYSAFSASGSSTVGDIMFARSADCGTTWGTPIKISSGSYAHQGATIAIKPVLGEVLVSWRRFAQAPRVPDSIFVAQSLSRGLNFQTPVKVADIAPFDQPTTTPSQSLPGTEGAGPAFRTNSYPTMAVDASGHVYLAWSQRGVGPTGNARIMVSSSYLGSSWALPQAAANADENGMPFLGHQIMPSLAFAAGKLILVWYDQRHDVSGTEYGFNNWVQDNRPFRHTMDVWAAVAETKKFPTLAWKSNQVSRYLYAALKDANGDLVYDANNNPVLFPAQFNCVNYTLFKGGLNAFMGDYIDVAASPTFRIDTWRNWYFNATSSDSPVFHVAWTDNRDVRPPLDGDWTKYTPANSTQLDDFISPEHSQFPCVGGNAPGMRNQNIYTSRVTWGIEAGSPTNSKPLNLSGDVARAFVVYVKNNTGSLRYYRLMIAAQPVGGQASFEQFGLLTTLDVAIAAYSTISRTVFISSTDPTAPVTINIDEINVSGSVITGGLESSILINGDPTNPQVPGGDETHNPNIINPANPNIINWYVNPNIINPNIINPNIINPNIINPNIINPNIINPNIINPNIINPNIINPNIINPNIINVPNPNIINPNIINPNIINPNIINSNPEDNTITDVAWTVRNNGTATTAYTLKTLSKKAPPEGVYVQLLVYRVHYTPAVAGAELSSSGISGCELKQEPHHELVLNIVNPNIINPNIINPNIINPNIINSSIENATISVAPGDEVIVDLRVLDTGVAQTKTQSQGMMKAMSAGASTQAFSVQDFVDSLGFAVTSQAVNSDDARAGVEVPPAAATELVIGTPSLPDGIAGTGYQAILTAYGGTGSYSWSLNSGELPPGLLVSSSGFISGTPTTAGTFYFIVRVDDGAHFDTQQYTIFIDNDAIVNPLAIVTTSLPSGVQGYWYGAALEASGGVWPRTWSLSGGSLPLGLSLDSGGAISGTPTTSGSFSFTVRVADNLANTATRLLSLTINSAPTSYSRIVGTVHDQNGHPLEGAVIRGLPNTPISGTDGTYEDRVPSGWSGTTAAFKVGYAFLPTSYAYSNVGADQTGQNFSGTQTATEEWAQKNVTGRNQILRDMAVDAAQNVYLTGADGGQIYTVKFDKNGTRQWEAPLLGTPGSNSHGDAIFVSPTGDVFVTGKIDDADILTVKYDGVSGAVLWSGLYDGGYPADEGADVAVDAMGNIYVTGWSWNVNGNPDYCTIKYRYDPIDHTYVSAWSRIFDGGGHDVADKIGIDVAGNVIVAGHSFGGTTLDDVYVVKYDGAGNELWHTRVDDNAPSGATNDYVTDLRLDGAGNVYVTGFRRAWPVEANKADYLTIKFNSSGTGQWIASYDGRSDQFDDIANALAVGPGGNVYVTGRSGARTDGQYVYDDYATIRYDSAGHAVWASGGDIDSFGAARYNGPPGTDHDVSNGIAVDINGNVYVTGASVGLDGSFDFATLKYSNSGTRLWVKRAGENNHIDDQAKVLALDPLGNIIVAGTSGSDLLLIKYAQDFSAQLVITTDILPAGVAGAGYSATLQAFGGTGSRVWGVSGLPAGLTFDGSSGLIGGTPSAPGTSQLTVTVNDGLLSDTKPVTLTITPVVGPAHQLAFRQQPINTVFSATMVPPVTVEIQDAQGNLVPTATNTVILSLRNAGSAILSGTLSKGAVGGIATFDDLSVDAAGPGYLLRANSGSLTEVDSIPFNITGGAATKVQVETQADGYGPIVPAQTIGTGSSITAYAIARSEPNNFVENVAVDSWSLVNKTGGVVDGDLVPAADMKSAVFTGHSLGSAQIHAVKSGLSSIDSGTISVGPGVLDHFDISAVPSPQTANAAFSITITAKDASGNTVTGYGGSNALTADAGTVNRYGVPINPSATGAFANGVWSGTVAIGATCKAAQIHTTGGGKSGQSNGFDVGSYWLTFTVQPTDIAAGSTIIVMVLVADPSDGSPILGAQVTLTMGNNPGGVTLNVSVVANANGYARIPFSINVPGNGYTVIASYTIPGFGTVSRESNPFNIY